ncbi:hypothetical protein JAAARDRAFT_136548, partial [Jaapia argillacea MUCL 33604]
MATAFGVSRFTLRNRYLGLTKPHAVAHDNHKTQPCDVRCFGPLQKVWINRVEEVANDTDDGIQKHATVHEYMTLQKVAIKPGTVKAAFRKTGIAPFDTNIFTDANFAPSRTTSTKACPPPMFP